MAVKFLNPAYETRVGDPTAKAVLIALANHCDNDGIAWASLTRLSEHTEFSLRAVQDALARLEGLQFLTVTKPGCGRRATTYKLTLQFKKDVENPQEEPAVDWQQLPPSETPDRQQLLPSLAAAATQPSSSCYPGWQQLPPIHHNPELIQNSPAATGAARENSDPSICSESVRPKKKKGAAEVGEAERDEAFEALAEAQGSDWRQLAGVENERLAKALRSIRKACPAVTAADIRAAVAEFRLRWPKAAVSAHGIAGHWSSLRGTAKKEKAAAKAAAPVPPEPEGWAEALRELYPRAAARLRWVDLDPDIRADVLAQLEKRKGAS